MFDLNKIQEEILADIEEKKRLQSDKKAAKVGKYGMVIILSVLISLLIYVAVKN